MPSSTAALVAFSASSTRSLRSFTSISVAPPTRITATPPPQLGETFLQLFLVVIGVGFLDLLLDLANAGLDVALLADAVHDGGVFLVHPHLLGGAQHVDLH